MKPTNERRPGNRPLLRLQKSAMLNEGIRTECLRIGGAMTVHQNNADYLKSFVLKHRSARAVRGARQRALEAIQRFEGAPWRPAALRAAVARSAPDRTVIDDRDRLISFTPAEDVFADVVGVIDAYLAELEGVR